MIESLHVFPGNASRKAAAVWLIVLFLLSCNFSGHRHHRVRAATKRSSRVPQKSSVAACNLDADFAQDRATLSASGFDKRIRLHFADTRSSELAFATTTADSGSLVAGDIDRDGDVDLVWVGSSKRDAVVLINHGDGSFAAAGDNAPYASELDDLFDGNEPSNRKRIKRGRRSSSLVTSSFHDVGFPHIVTPEIGAVLPVSFTVPEPLAAESFFVCYLRKRGPPSIVS